MRFLLRVLLLALAYGAGTVVFGWWAVPVLAVLWGVIAFDRPRVGTTSALAGALAWGGILAWHAARGPLLPFADRLGGVMQQPGALLLVLTVVFPAAVAASASVLAAARAAFDIQRAPGRRDVRRAGAA